MTDDLPALRYGGRMVRPERDSYSYTPSYGVISARVAGSLSRLGRASYGDPANVSCTYILNNQSMHVWWDDFFNFTISQGSKRFTAELLVNGVIKTHVCQISGVPRLTTNGWFGKVEVSLEVVPVLDRCSSLSRQALMACYGDQSGEIVSQIIDVGLLLNKAW